MGERSAARLVAALLLLGLAAGCGSDSADTPPVVGPLPTGPDDAQAYTEAFLEQNPGAELQPEHLVVVDLGPTGGEDGDTCADRDGVDCLPYTFVEATQLTLSIAHAPEELEELLLRDAGGGVVLRAADGAPAATAVVAAGSYVLELRHLFAGSEAAAPRLVFVRPEATEIDSVGPADVAAAADGTLPATAPVAAMQLSASADCVGCDFAKADLTEQTFDGATLSESIFDGATMLNTTFLGATMEDCSLLDLPVVFPLPKSNGKAFNADFSRATMTGSAFSFDGPGNFGFVGIFRDAILAMTHWEKKFARPQPENEVVCRDTFFCSTLAGDFRNADLRGARFAAMRFNRNFAAKPAFDCTFQGADLSGADFRPVPPVKALAPVCRFDREPETGDITVLRGANLTGVRVHGVLPPRGSFADADLSGAILDDADFGSTSATNPAQDQGANFSRANLTGASLARTRFANANLTGAILTGVTPGLAGLDLRLTDLGGAILAGLDLSHVDLGQVQSFRDRAPHLAGAILTDGTVGVTLTDQVFPPGYEELKGADLSGATLTRTELLRADLEGATLNRIKAVGANFTFANLRGAKLRGAELGVEPGREIAAASLRGAFMPDVDLTDADLRSVNLAGAHLYGDTARTLLIRTRLDSANFSKAICSGAHFSGTLSNAVFDGAQLVNTVFNGATMTNAKLDDAYLQGADFSSAVGVTGVVLSNSAVAAVPGTWSFTEQDGTPFVFRYEATKLGPLATDASVRCPNGSKGPCCPTNDLTACLGGKLKPVGQGPFPPVPACVPKAPRYDNCITPRPTRTPRPTPTPTPR
ncbi:MAG: pentapeptide repeat-containing protein [Deltaproteobacteria bacterium]|nr:pentapeptide repeat-containing protein [Deltaproteobacteria bacterium]